MASEKRGFLDMLKDERSGGEKPAGLSWEKFKSDIAAELSHLGKQGSHELAAALFTGSAFVMYPHAGQEQEAHHGLPTEAQGESRGVEM